MMARSCNRNLQYRRVGNYVGGSDVIIGSSDDDVSGRSSVNGDSSPPATHTTAAAAAVRLDTQVVHSAEPETRNIAEPVLPPNRSDDSRQGQSRSTASSFQVGKCVAPVTYSVPQSTAATGSGSARQTCVKPAAVLTPEQ